MSYQLKPGSGIIFMKVGLHAGETIEEIIARKRREYDEAGVIFWGYGGGTCHPANAVQPFLRERQELGQEVLLVMQKMDSHHTGAPEIAKAYSEDGVVWKPMPKGVEVRGSRYAMVLDKLEPQDFDLDLNCTRVAIGVKRNTCAADYIRGHVDKACIEYTGAPINPEPHQARKHIDLAARILPPYAVFLTSDERYLK